MPVSPTTDVGIVSRALVRLGQAPIQSFTAPIAQKFDLENEYYETRRSRLAKGTWFFAFREQLQPELASPVNDFSDQFDTAFAVPNDSLRVLGLMRAGTVLASSQYIISGNEIWTNHNDARVVFITDVQAESLPAYFVQAMKAEMAALLAFAISDDSTKAIAWRQEADDRWAEAMVTDAQEFTNLRLRYEQLINQSPGERY